LLESTLTVCLSLFLGSIKLNAVITKNFEFDIYCKAKTIHAKWAEISNIIFWALLGYILLSLAANIFGIETG
jgi:hypothetical protein